MSTERPAIPEPTRTPEEREAIIAKILEDGRKLRAASTPEEIDRAVNHGDWLYDENGLPKSSSSFRRRVHALRRSTQ